MATGKLLRAGIVCSVIAFVCMFLAFATPFWYQSWTRVHSPFGSIGLWSVCLSGYIKPRDPVMKSYVGCWWIHSTEFSDVSNDIMPVWFRFVQAFSIFAMFGDLFAMIFTIGYLPAGIRGYLYKKRPRMFLINSALLLGAAFLVFLIALVFAEKSNDSDWMPRPWMNYLSWSYGLCVLSGFFSAFGGMCLFILALVFRDKEANGDPGVTSAAELAAKRRELEKQDEAMRSQPGMLLDTYPPRLHGSTQQMYNRQPNYQQQPAYQDKLDYGRAPSATGSQTVYGKAPSTTGSYGGYGRAPSTTGSQAYARAPHTGGSQSYGKAPSPDSKNARVGESFV